MSEGHRAKLPIGEGDFSRASKSGLYLPRE
jgi:hypothetical protein